jgi:predicted dehydrogenase
VKTIRWGLIGAGWIATKAIVPAMHAADNAIVQAVASRDSKRAKALNPVTIHDSYDALINDPLVDAVYISLPNHLHCEWSVKALNVGKHVLCEKPFAMNASEVEAMAKAAHENDRVLVEAVSARWHPRVVRLVEYVLAGNIGEIITIDSSFTFPAAIDGNYRLSKEMGGGALFDVGIYPLHAMAALVNGPAQTVIESCDRNIGPSGVDLTTKWKMRLNGSISANGLASFEEPENQSLVVRGTNGVIEIVGRDAFTSWHSPSSLKIVERIEEFEPCDPYKLMIENFGKRVHGEESWVIPLETSIWVQKTLDLLRNS